MCHPALPRSRHLCDRGGQRELSLHGRFHRRVLRTRRASEEPRSHGPGCPRPRGPVDGGCFALPQKVPQTNSPFVLSQQLKCDSGFNRRGWNFSLRSRSADKETLMANMQLPHEHSEAEAEVTPALHFTSKNLHPVP